MKSKTSVWVVLASMVPMVGCTIVTNPSGGEDAGTHESGDETTLGETSGQAGGTTDSDETTPEKGETKDGHESGPSSDQTSEPKADTSVTTSTSGDGETGNVTTEGQATGDEPTTDTGADAPAFECGEPDLDDAPILTGNIGGDQALSGTYIVEGEASLNDGEITIAPGTHFVMKADSTLQFGQFSTATVKAEGTAAEPITFCGEEPGPGFWGYVSFRDISSNSKISNVLFDGAGFGLHSEALVENVVVRDAADGGVVADAFKEGSSGLFISGCGDEGMVFGTPAAVTNFPTGSKLTGNGKDVATVAFTRIDYSTVFHDIGVPYVMSGNVDCAGDGALTLEAGVEIRFAADSNLEIGSFNAAYTLNIQGTEEAPVVFRGETEEPGFWQGFWVDATVLTNSKIEHLTVKHGGGGDTFPVAINAAIEVSHLTLEDNLNPAYISSAGLKSTSTDWNISGSETYPLQVGVGALLSLPKDSHYTGNAEDELVVVESRLEQSGTISPQDVPFVLRDGLVVAGTPELTFDAGCTFLMAADAIIDLAAFGSEPSITMVGTEDAPIVFKGEEETAGFWSGVRVQDTLSTDSAFEWVEVRHGGGEALDANLELQVAVPVSHCTFASSAGWGLLKPNADATDYEAENSFDDNASGAVGSY